MILTSLPEWCLLQRIAIATGGVKGRLARLGPKRSSSSSNQVLLGYIGNNDLAFLETELRSLLMWETPYAQSVQSTFDQLSRELKSLCGALENLVNSALLIGKEANPDSDDSLDPAKGYTTHYPKLWRLWTCLENTFFDAGGVLPSWDSQRIFLAAPRGSPLQDGQLYVGFVPPFDDEVECSNQFGNPIFLGFAKLLLEIEEGQKIDLSHCANVYSQVGELCSRIAKLQADGRNHYAEAVRHCVLPSPSPHDGEDDKTAVQRILSEQVIGYLEADLKPTGLPHNKRRRSSSIQQSSTSADTPSQRRKTEHSNVEGYASSTISGSYCSESPVDVPIEPLAQSELSGRLVETISGQPRQCSEDKDGYIHRSELLSGREQ
ncbi:unnamed protein product [Alternaria alternata]